MCGPLEQSAVPPNIKIGIEVKAVFTKNHPSIQNPAEYPIIEHRIMFIHWILQKVVVGHLAQVDLEALGSLISSIEWQCLDENHNRDSVHILHNIFEFQIHIYSANAMQAGGGWIPLPERIAGAKAVINPHNNDDYFFLYAVQLGLVDFSREHNCRQIPNLQKLVREQGVFINCSLEMPVEPTDNNFKKFEQENPFLHLKIYTPAAAGDEKCPITPLYVGMNRATKIVNILYYRNEETSHYAYIRNISQLIHSATKCHHTSLSAHTVLAPTSILRRHSTTTWTRSNHTSGMNLCVRNASMCFTHKRQNSSMTASAWSKRVSRELSSTQPMINPSAGKRDNYMLSRIPTWLVAIFECILLKEEQMKGMNTKIIHKHQPCAWGLTVVTERKGASYDQTFVKVAQNVGEAMETFVYKILEIAQQVYHHEQMLIPMEKLEGMKKTEFDTAKRCYICHDPFKGLAKKKVADHDHVTGSSSVLLVTPAISRGRAAASSSLCCSTTQEAMTCTHSSRRWRK